MNVLSNIAQPNVNIYRGGSNPNNMYHRQNGFTLLQGHIQLMAMVPHLPENQTSPRSRHEGNTTSHQQCENSLPMITPRMMPSASKYKRPYLPSILAGKVSRDNSGYPVSYHSLGNSCWQPPRTSSNVSLPPKNSQPITMPSFARCLPGTKRAIGHGTAFMPGTPCNTRFDSSNTCFPIIPTQPSYHNTSTLEMMGANHHQMGPIYPQQLNVQNPTLVSPQQMAYQMVNVVSSNQHPHSQLDFMGGSGDHAMASVIHQIQQQQNYEHYPYQHYSPNDVFQYSQQPHPYAVQSMPCFGTLCTLPNNASNFTLHNYPGGIIPASKTNGFVLSSISTPTPESPQPVYSASMPEICLGAIPAPVHHARKNKKNGISNKQLLKAACKKEVAIVLDGSSSSLSSSEEEEEEGILEETSKGSKSISVLKLREIQKKKEEEKAKQEAKYAELGPETNPDKIPSNPRVAHTPVLVPPPPQEDKHQDVKDDEKCTKGECCCQCKCCRKNNDNCIKNQQGNLEEKVKEMRSKLTPRRKCKPVVLAVHDCFPSDSSVTDAETDMDSARKSCFNYTGNNGAVVRKRKPTINAILKSRMKGDSSEVFDDLENDLNPDEARTYTCDYLVELLTSEEWNNCYTALQVIIRLARHRPKVLLNYLSGPILWCTFHHITSPKSALCRAAIVTFKELFQRIGSALDNDLEKITEKLVLKSLAPNMFIREECDRALEAMVAHCNLVKVLNAMDIVSKRPHARAAGHRLAKMALQIVQVAGVDLCLKPLYAEKLLPMLFCFMTEANNGTRTAAKEALGMLMNHLQFEAAVTRHVTFDKNCTEVFKKLDKMRGRTRNRRQVGNSRFPLPHAHFRR